MEFSLRSGELGRDAENSVGRVAQIDKPSLVRLARLRSPNYAAACREARPPNSREWEGEAPAEPPLKGFFNSFRSSAPHGADRRQTVRRKGWEIALARGRAIM